MTATVVEYPAEIHTTSCQSETMHCPNSLLPAATTVPSAHSPTVCFPPAEMATILFHAEVSHRPFPPNRDRQRPSTDLQAGSGLREQLHKMVFVNTLLTYNPTALLPAQSCLRFRQTHRVSFCVWRLFSVVLRSRKKARVFSVVSLRTAFTHSDSGRIIPHCRSCES